MVIVEQYSGFPVCLMCAQCSYHKEKPKDFYYCHGKFAQSMYMYTSDPHIMYIMPFTHVHTFALFLELGKELTGIH